MAARSAGRARPSTHGDALDKTFFWSLVAKGVSGLAELIGGVVLLVVSPQHIHNLSHRLAGAGHHRPRDPHDVIINLIVHHTERISQATLYFAAIYLLGHGVLKLVLVAAVLRDRLWAYPWLIWSLVAFMVYQSYEFTQRPSVGLVLLTVFDAFVVWLTVIEYRRKRAASTRSARSAPEGESLDSGR